jgi:hypothetical protein
MSLVLLSVLAFTGCGSAVTGVPGSGVSKTESREVEDFHSIEMLGAGKVNASEGDGPTLSITTDDNLLELISTKVVDGVLVIKPLESISPKSGITFEVSATQLKSLEVSGAGKFTLSELSGPELAIKIAGAGSVGGNGNVESLEIVVEGAGSVDLGDLKSKSTNIEISGAGSATVFASESVDASVNGVGTITVHGNPQDVVKSVGGIGKINIDEN